MDNYFKIEFCPDEFPSSDDEFDLELSIATPVSPVGQDAHGMWTPLGRGPDGAEHNSFSNHSQGEHHAGRELTHVSEAEFHTEFTGSERPPRDVQNCDIYQEAISHPVKKPKLEWTPELHWQFVQVVESLPVDKQVPSKILEHMGECGIGLTRANIASHLQKYRLRKSSRVGTHRSLHHHKMPLPPQPNLVLGVPCFPAAHPLPHVLGVPVPPPAPSYVFDNRVTSAGSVPEGHLPCLPAPCFSPGMDMHTLTSPLPTTLSRQLQEVLRGKSTEGSLGLSLDYSAVAQQWNNGTGW